MRKRIVGALAALFAAVLFVAPTTALADWPKTGIWVDGQDLMADDDHAITCSGGGTAQYDPDTLTLTLTDAQITRLDDQGKGIDAPTQTRASPLCWTSRARRVPSRHVASPLTATEASTSLARAVLFAGRPRTLW